MMNTKIEYVGFSLMEMLASDREGQGWNVRAPVDAFRKPGRFIGKQDLACLERV